MKGLGFRPTGAQSHAPQMWVVLTAAVVLVKQFLMRLLILQPGATNSSQAQGAGTKTCKLVAVTQLCVRVSVSVWEGRALRGADALKPVEPVTQTQTHICNLHVLTHRLPAETGCTLLQHPCGCTHMCVCMPTVAALFSLLRLIGCTPSLCQVPHKALFPVLHALGQMVWHAAPKIRGDAVSVL